MLIEFDANGFVVVPGAVPWAEASLAAVELERRIPGWAQACGVRRGAYLRAVCKWGTDNPLVQTLTSAFAEPLQPLMESIVGQSVERVGATLFRKSWQARAGTHAHQDAPYSREEGGRLRFTITSWIALSEIDAKTGALELLPGSHLEATSERVDFLAPEFMDRARTPSWRRAARTIACQPGDAIVFDPFTWHASRPCIGGRRVALAIRWRTAGDDRTVERPSSDLERFGIDTSGRLVNEALRRLLGPSDPTASDPGKKTEALCDEVLRQGALDRLPDPQRARAALDRYLLCRRAYDDHRGSAQGGMVWERLRVDLTDPAGRLR